MKSRSAVIYVRYSIISVSLILTACSTIPTHDTSYEARLESAPIVIISPQPRNIADPTVLTKRTTREYYEDLEHCQQEAEHNLGSVRATDNVAAIKRALQNGITGNSLNVGFNATDPTVKRGYAVKRCMSGKGYLVR